MLKTIGAVTLIASTLSIGPALAAPSATQSLQPSALIFTAMGMHMMNHMPWCSAHVRHHCRPHHKMMMKKTM